MYRSGPSSSSPHIGEGCKNVVPWVAIVYYNIGECICCNPSGFARSICSAAGKKYVSSLEYGQSTESQMDVASVYLVCWHLFLQFATWSKLAVRQRQICSKLTEDRWMWRSRCFGQTGAIWPKVGLSASSTSYTECLQSPRKQAKFMSRKTDRTSVW